MVGEPRLRPSRAVPLTPTSIPGTSTSTPAPAEEERRCGLGAEARLGGRRQKWDIHGAWSTAMSYGRSCGLLAAAERQR